MNTKDSSKILLLCLNTEKSVRKSKEIMITDIYDCFGRFGGLQKILVFSKAAISKAFIEFDEFEHSSTARTALHNETQSQLGLMKLFFSTQTSLERSNRYVEFWQSGQEKPQHDSDELKTCISA